MMQIQLSSPAFTRDRMIPSQYTCDGDNISPPLTWEEVPGGTASLALICDDPDAPVGTWVHWVLFNLPPDLKKLAEDTPPEKVLQNGAKHGTNDFDRLGYGGPCPPSGTHRYFFKLYALDATLDEVATGVTKAELLETIDQHTLAVGTLIGKYQRSI